MSSRLEARVQYYAWRTVSAVIRRVPPRAAYAVASVIGSGGFYLWPRGRRAMLANYQRVLPNAGAAERRAVARQSLVNYCKYLADFIRFPAMTADRLIAEVEGSSAFDSLNQALERGKGAVIVCMHFGNWDLGAGATAARGYPVTVVAETFADPRLDAMVAGARQRLGMKIVKMEKVGPSMLRSLNQNGVLSLLIDRPTPGKGVRVNFFGEEVEVPAGPARLALRTGATIVAAAFARVDPHRLAVTTLCDFGIRTEASGDDERDIRDLTQAIMDSHERFIRQYPEQWYMFRSMWAREPQGVRS